MRTWSLVAVFLFFGACAVEAADFLWSGRYRFEGLTLSNAELGKNLDRSYGLHHFVLSPKIIAADGVEVISQFDLFNSDAYPNSQVGQYFGNGPHTSTVADRVDSQNSSTLSRTQNSETLKISKLYLNWTHELGSLVVGRAPIHFGLGLTHNGGTGDFDHWFTTKDLVAYRMIAGVRGGTLTLIPMIGKVYEGGIVADDDVNDFMFQLQYDNPDSHLSLGFLYESRVAGDGGNDTPQTSTNPTAPLGGTGSVVGEGYSAQNINIFMTQQFDQLRFGLEGGFTSGSTGLKTSQGSVVGLKGIGLATELDWLGRGSWNYHLKAGMASGDNSTTDESFEGFIFNKNYDVALILFNHFVGRFDLFKTSLDIKKDSTAISGPDIESLSNVIYLAPGADWKWTDRWSLNMRLIYALVQEKPAGRPETASDVGTEFDFGIAYKPYPGLTWINEVGMLFPGAAFRGGDLGYDSNLAFALSTRIGVNF